LGKKSQGVLLQESITPHAPLVARRLADVTQALAGKDDMKSLEASFLRLLGDARAFFMEIYDARNRIVHRGELGRLPDRAAPLNLEALVVPLVDVLGLVLDELQRSDAGTLPEAWANLTLRATDLAAVSRLREMSAEEFVSLLEA
jgi:hypothetical protein